MFAMAISRAIISLKLTINISFPTLEIYTKSLKNGILFPAAFERRPSCYFSIFSVEFSCVQFSILKDASETDLLGSERGGGFNEKNSSSSAYALVMFSVILWWA